MVVPLFLHLVSEMGFMWASGGGQFTKNEACGQEQSYLISGARLLCKVVQLLI